MTWSRRIAIVAAVVACFGLVDSGYLTIKHLQGSYIRCGDDCSAVLGSKYAEGVAGVPLAGFGAAAYMTVIVAAVFAARSSTLGRQILAIMATTMALVSLVAAASPGIRDPLLLQVLSRLGSGFVEFGWIGPDRAIALSGLKRGAIGLLRSKLQLR